MRSGEDPRSRTLSATPCRLSSSHRCFTVSDQPGTGLDPDPDAVERFARGPWRTLDG